MQYDALTIISNSYYCLGTNYFLNMCFIYIFTNYIYFFIVRHIPDIVIREREGSKERKTERNIGERDRERQREK